MQVRALQCVGGARNYPGHTTPVIAINNNWPPRSKSVTPATYYWCIRVCHCFNFGTKRNSTSCWPASLPPYLCKLGRIYRIYCAVCAIFKRCEIRNHQTTCSKPSLQRSSSGPLGCKLRNLKPYSLDGDAAACSSIMISRARLFTGVLKFALYLCMCHMWTVREHHE